MRDVAIVQYLRTPQSRSRPQEPGKDWLFKMRSDDLLAALLPEILRRSGVAPAEVDDFIMGCAQAVSEQFTLGGRMPLLLANLDARTSCKLLDEQCGSAMAALHMGYMEIAMGHADVVLCGGMEHMTRVGMGGDGAIDFNLRCYTDPAMRHWDMITATSMGLTAEKLARLGGLTRQEMDAWGVRSHQRAAQAQADGFLAGEILPLSVRQADGTTMVVDRDQSIRTDATVEGMAELRPAFLPTGTITAGSSSPLNAGATAVLLMADDLARRRGLTPLATVRSIGFAGVEPSLMGKGPVPATERALARAGLQASDIDVWEINEAFSAVVLYAIKQLGLDPERVNVRGGGIAIGHPLGASGLRIVGTLCRIMAERGVRLGCATMCCGGGQGVTTIVERRVA